MKTPRGRLVIIGGSEHKGIPDDKNQDRQETNPDFMPQEILKRIISEACNKDAPVEVVPTASSIPDEVGNDYLNAFEKMECGYARVLDIREREEASDEEILKRIEKAGAILFSGGDQLRLSTILGGTPALELIYKRYLND